MMRRVWAVLAIPVLVIAACSDDEGGGTTTSEAAATTTAGDTTTSEVALSLDDWREAADGICTEIDEAGQPLDEATTEEEVLELLPEVAAAAVDGFEELEALGIPDEDGDLVEQALGLLDEKQGHLQEAVDAAEEGGMEAAQPHIEAMGPIDDQLDELADELGLEVCGDQEDLEPGTDDTATDDTATDDTGSGEIDGYGDDPELDALWDACEEGDGQACDDLFMESAFGSEYEDFGDTCGGRFESDGSYCATRQLD